MTPQPVPTKTPGAPIADSQGPNVQLQKIAEDAEKRVPKQFLDKFNRIMAAGKKAMFSETTFGMKGGTKEYLDSITDVAQIPDKIAHGVIKLLALLWNQSKGTMPIEPVGAAAIIFMCDGLEYLQDVKKMPIDNAVIDKTTFAVKDGTLAFIKDSAMKKGMSEEDVMKGMTGQHGQNQPAPKAPPTAPPAEAASVEEEEA